MTSKTLCNSYLTIKDVEDIIKYGADVDEKDEHGDTPLFYTINPLHKNKNLAIAKLLIENGADVNAKNEYGSSLLFYADDLSMVNLLIAHGANVNAKNNDLNSPIHVSDLEKTKLLITHGADINQRNRYGDTPFDLAEDAEIATYLIEHGGIAGKISNYIENKHFFSDEQQDVFDTFVAITGNDDDFFQMCLAYQNNKNIKIEIKDMDILC